ncbi:MAG: hypothetical protein KC983_06220, partial [Phycisphaerales bacterium]|nr:hypothetical protein [Phycisphaerales bacterium]
QRLEAEALRTTSPEAEAWTAAVWPKLTAEQERAAILTVRAESAARLEQFGLSWQPIDAGSFIIYTDMPREIAVRWTRSLERGLSTLYRALGIPSLTNLFWGKCIVYVFKDRDAFELVEAEAFQQLLPGSRHAICHFIGPQTYIVAHHDGDPQMFEWRLMRELTHAVMHRHHSPRRPPGWLNEGFALHIADALVTPAAHKVLHRELALTFIREGGDVNDVFELEYAHPKWPGPTTENVRSFAEGADVAGLGPAVGALVCERLIGDAPDRFAAWIGAIKRGGSWDEAMSSTLGTSREKLAAYITAWYRVND